LVISTFVSLPYQIKRNMVTPIQIAPVLAAIKKAGDLFLRQYKTNTIPQDKEDLLRQLQSIDDTCISLLKSELDTFYPGIPYAGDEFGYDEQRGPLKLPV
jgi:myo-inositol-1(or 4)-monophosphatase